MSYTFCTGTGGNLCESRAADFKVQASALSTAVPVCHGMGLTQAVVAQKGWGGWKRVVKLLRNKAETRTKSYYLQGAHTALRELSQGPSKSQHPILRPKLTTWTTRYKKKENHSSHLAASSCGP